jgi:hypothetical protein
VGQVALLNLQRTIRRRPDGEEMRRDGSTPPLPNCLGGFSLDVR